MSRVREHLAGGFCAFRVAQTPRWALVLTVAALSFGAETVAASDSDTPPLESHPGRIVAHYGFDDRSARLGSPPPWRVPETFGRAVDPAIIVAVQSFGRELEPRFALRISASDAKVAPRSAEPAPVYHWSRGSAYVTLDAAPYHGRILRVLATVKLAKLFDGRTRISPSRFWVRTDTADPSAVPLVHQDSENEISAGWREISIDVPVFENAEHVHFGLDVRQGAADIAEVRVVDLGPSGIAPPDPLSALETDRLVILSRLLGWVRFFHPSDSASETEWDAFSIEAIETVLALDASAPLVPTLRKVFRPVAPTLVIEDISDGPSHQNGSKVPAPQNLADVVALSNGAEPRPEGALRAVRWNHYGLGVFPGDHPYRSDRLEMHLPAPPDSASVMPGSASPVLDVFRDPLGDRPIDTYHEDALRSGPLEISVGLPLVLYSGVNGTLPLAEPLPPDIRAFRTKPYGFLPVAEDRTTRLAGAMRLWNVAQHFYPNFDEIECDWLAVLPWGLREVATAADRSSFVAALERMLVPLQDGHAGVYPYYDDDSGHLPLEVQILDGTAWVTGVDPHLSHPGDLSPDRTVEVGDALVAIDGVPVTSLLLTLGNQVSAATAGSHQIRTRDKMLRGRVGEVRRCTFSRGGTGPTYTLPLSLSPTDATKLRIAGSRLPAIADLGHGVLYLDAGRLDDAAFDGSLSALSAARGVVIDCRGYPGGLTPRWLEHWIEEPTQSPQWHVALDRAPDRSSRSWVVRDWTITPRGPRITAPTVFLTNAAAISRAETYLSIVRHAAIGQIVGSTTAGTNGNLLPFTLPGGLRITITGMKVRDQEGGRFHGIGVVPHRSAEPTASGVRAGEDEVLKAGIDLVLEGF